MIDVVPWPSMVRTLLAKPRVVALCMVRTTRVPARFRLKLSWTAPAICTALASAYFVRKSPSNPLLLTFPIRNGQENIVVWTIVPVGIIVLTDTVRSRSPVLKADLHRVTLIRLVRIILLKVPHTLSNPLLIWVRNRLKWL